MQELRHHASISSLSVPHRVFVDAFLHVDGVKAAYKRRCQILLRCVIFLGIKRCIYHVPAISIPDIELSSGAMPCPFPDSPTSSIIYVYLHMLRAARQYAYLDWIPTPTLGMAQSITLPDLGNPSIALEMLLGIERRIFLQQRLRLDEHSNTPVSRVSVLFFRN